MSRLRYRIVRVGELAIDPARFEVKVRRRAVRLTPIESRLLCILGSRAGKTLPRKALMKLVWGGVHVQERTVDAHILGLRTKLKRLGRGWPRLETIWGVGYRLRTE